MLSNAPVAPTLPVTDMARARRFYEEKLGLKPSNLKTQASEMYYDCGMGTKLMLYQRPMPSACDHTAADFMVEDIEKEAKELRSKGIVFEEYDIPEMGIKTVNGIATMNGFKGAWFKDPDGNILAIGQVARVPAGTAR
ncbi:MAG: VOC family protein [Chloroflexi bacterium]|nr:VOC family protein [Chloroflexota bacterium]